MDDSAIICDEVIESYEEETNLNENKAICKTQNFYILLAFLLITIALLIAVSIYCYLVKYRSKQKKFCINKCITKISTKLKDIDMKNRTYYFFHDIVNIELLIQIILKQTKSPTKILLFTILEM